MMEFNRETRLKLERKYKFLSDNYEKEYNNIMKYSLSKDDNYIRFTKAINMLNGFEDAFEMLGYAFIDGKLTSIKNKKLF